MDLCPLGTMMFQPNPLNTHSPRNPSQVHFKTCVIPMLDRNRLTGDCQAHVKQVQSTSVLRVCVSGTASTLQSMVLFCSRQK